LPRSARALAATLITFGSLAGGANAATITFDDAWASLGQNADPSSFYSTLGVTISGLHVGLVGGVGNGDPGNWWLEGTVGSAFLGTNQGNSGNPTFAFTGPQTGSLDIGVPYGWTSTFLISGSLNGLSVFSRNITIEDDNNGQGTWMTFGFYEPIDSLQVQLTTGAFPYGFAYGIDNVSFTAVPEPSSVLAIGGLICGGLLLRVRRKSA
jgi:hypothetical protein